MMNTTYTMMSNQNRGIADQAILGFGWRAHGKNCLQILQAGSCGQWYRCQSIYAQCHLYPCQLVGVVRA